MQARWGTHGDHPIIVLAAATTRDCFDLTVAAFNLSEKYRTPVILLTDEVVAHTREKVVLPEPKALEVVDRLRPTAPPEWYVPYADTASGVPVFCRLPHHPGHGDQRGHVLPAAGGGRHLHPDGG